MQSAAPTPADYLAALPPDRRELVSAIRDTINANLPEGYQEGMQYGMIGWSVPHARFPDGYHCDPRQPVPFVSLANQKGAVSIYLFCVYLGADLTEDFVAAWKATGKRLDMGKSCVRVKKLADVPLEVIGQTIRKLPLADFLARYQAQIPAASRKKGR